MNSEEELNKLKDLIFDKIVLELLYDKYSIEIIKKPEKKKLIEKITTNVEKALRLELNLQQKIKEKKLPWKPPQGSNNGINRCWLNSALYAVLSNFDIRDKLRKCNNNDNDVVELKKFINESTAWDENIYPNFIETMNIDKCRKEILLKGAWGDFNESILHISNILKKCKIDIRYMPVAVIDEEYPDYSNAISIISITECVDSHKSDVGSHFISFTKFNNEWYMVDSMTGFEPKKVSTKYITSYKKLNCELGKTRLMYNIYHY